MAVEAGVPMVVGTTGWYQHLDKVRELVAERKGAVLYGSNFSVGMNFFFKAMQAVAPVLKYGYRGSIVERHHVHKKDKPSGTAVLVGVSRRGMVGSGSWPRTVEVCAIAATRAASASSPPAMKSRMRRCRSFPDRAGRAESLAGVTPIVRGGHYPGNTLCDFAREERVKNQGCAVRTLILFPGTLRGQGRWLGGR